MGYDNPHHFGAPTDDEDIQLPDYYKTAEEPDSVPTTEGSASAYTFDNYQDDAGITAIYPDSDTGSPAALSYVILGLAGEAGELANKYKKILRDKGGVPDLDDYHGIGTEIGGVLWYAARICEELGIKLSTVANENIRKLSDRKSRNVLRGSGDDR